MYESTHSAADYGTKLNITLRGRQNRWNCFCESQENLNSTPTALNITYL